MGFFAKFKEAFAASERAQFLGDDGSLVVLHADYIERIWGRSTPARSGTDAADGDGIATRKQANARSSQHSEMWDLESVEAVLSVNADALTISSEKFQWEIPVGSSSRLANEAALFVNRVNAASKGPNYSFDTFVHKH